MNKEILKSISEIVDKKISSLPYYKKVPSVVYGKDGSKYKVVIDGQIYLVENATPISLSAGDMVWVEIPNKQMKNMHISGLRNIEIGSNSEFATVKYVDNKLPFSFGIDDKGNYGYYKKGEEKLTPFGSGGGNGNSSISINNIKTNKALSSSYSISVTSNAEVFDDNREYYYKVETISIGNTDAQVKISKIKSSTENIVSSNIYLYSNTTNTNTFDNILTIKYDTSTLQWILGAVGLVYCRNTKDFYTDTTIQIWSYDTMKILSIIRV